MKIYKIQAIKQKRIKQRSWRVDGKCGRLTDTSADAVRKVVYSGVAGPSVIS